MAYVDGYVLPVPHANKEKYREVAQMMAGVFQEYGALRVVECWGQDVPEGEHTDFHKAVKIEDGEAVVFSWVTWPDKATRDEGWKKVMADPRCDMKPDEMPFDGKRMFFGGFEPIVDEGQG